MTHEQRLEDLRANPAFSQGLSPQEAEIFQAMCGELSGLAAQIAGPIAAEKVNQVSSGANVDLLMLFQSVSTALSDDAGEESLWDQFQGQIAEAQATLSEICQYPISAKERDTARRQVEGLLRQMDRLDELEVSDSGQNRHSFWSRLPSRVKAVLFYKLFRGGSMKPLWQRLTPLLYGLALCLPLALKLGVPLVLEQGERLGLFVGVSGDRTPENFYTVDSVQGLLLKVHQPNQPSVQLQLAGLTEPDERWQDEATGILSMLVQASQNRVTVSFIKPKQPDSAAKGLVQLPTGAYVLSEGVAQLDRTQLDGIPTETALMFQQAEASARTEHKNIWSRG